MTTKLNINKPTWHWHYCNQSGWSFQIGEPQLDVSIRQRNPFNQQSPLTKYRIVGEMTIHAFCCDWIIGGNSYVECTAESSIDTIQSVMAKMDGIAISDISLHLDGWVQRMMFDQGVFIDIIPMADSDMNSICSLIYRTATTGADVGD